MNKEKIIKKSDDFSKIISTGKNIKNKYISLYYKESNSTLYGITVPKKTGHAVVRNRLKRRVKNIIRTNEISIQLGYNYVIIIKEPSLNLTYEELTSNLLEVFKKVGRK